jgi:hypothetical protein
LAVRKLAFVVGLIALALAGQQGAAQRRAARPALAVGTCVRTTIREVGQRLEDGVTHRPMPDSGSAVEFANGLYQVSYDQVPAVNQSRRGDPVFVCLMSLPQHCPPGDVRGKLYTTTNLRTEESWTLPDAEHGCGGA